MRTDLAASAGRQPERSRAAVHDRVKVLELTFAFGPPLALGLAAIWSPGATLAFSGLVMLAGTILFAAHPRSRAWQPSAGPLRPRGAALSAPAVRTLILLTFSTGAMFGATELAVTAAAHAHHATPLAGPLLGVWAPGRSSAGSPPPG
jgi:hypothetical protein